MALRDDLSTRVAAIFKDPWTKRDGQVVPTDASVGLGNDAVKISGCVLYADLADSTKLVDSSDPYFAAEIYKTFLHCASKIITNEGGSITAFDGDRVMSVFIGEYKCTRAVKAALKINWVSKSLIQSALRKQYRNTSFVLNHVCGIDTSDLVVAKTGIRGSNDLVWVGRAANYAAKLSAMDHTSPTWITDAVYNVVADEVKYHQVSTNMWVPARWAAMDNKQIYRSTYWWVM